MSDIRKLVMLLRIENIFNMQSFNHRVQYTFHCQQNEILPRQNFLKIFLDALN
jgi:hypothetical protein